ncbi:hypothetical protein MtrunA17_Chr1g0205241 [Medicago truncatula]|uniref:Transmembrane protein n=1 Tax=Medicago truncatula TaxID=3880 RepID=A0A396K255_MEDTR|nr:hypothetical protein MtrunA17_Chr1g0205241 [Medicago truncatula]
MLQSECTWWVMLCIVITRCFFSHPLNNRKLTSGSQIKHLEPPCSGPSHIHTVSLIYVTS